MKNNKSIYLHIINYILYINYVYFPKLLCICSTAQKKKKLYGNESE